MPHSIPALAASVDRALRAAGSPGRAVQEKRYLKSALAHYGATVPAIRRAVITLRREHPDLSGRDAVRLAEALWAKRVHERRMAAVEVLDVHGDRLAAADLRVVERFLREAKTWALVDGLAASVAGRLIERFPALGPALDRWAADPDFWLRRSALLALLGPLRAGGGDFSRFGRYADALLDEKEFFIRKAIGWVLRETAKKRPALVYEWLAPRVARASGVTLREAVRYLPEARRDELLRARPHRGPAVRAVRGGSRGRPGRAASGRRSTASAGRATAGARRASRQAPGRP